jgi:hypothetical protein
MLPVMEHFYTIQGEGFHAGKQLISSVWADAMWVAIGVM